MSLYCRVLFLVFGADLTLIGKGQENTENFVPVFSSFLPFPFVAVLPSHIWMYTGMFASMDAHVHTDAQTHRHSHTCRILDHDSFKSANSSAFKVQSHLLFYPWLSGLNKSCFPH